MKKIISYLSIFSIVAIFLLTLLCVNVSAKTSSPLDEIQYYEVKIDPRNDGTLDMHYTLVWKVLDDESEGPLEWIKVGNPNDHVDEIVGISENIDEIRSYEESGDSYIRIDLDREYNAGETLTIEYTIHQSYMYIVEEDSHLVRYSFTAGWFPDINVKKLKILWNSDNVLEASTTKQENGYYIWEDSLNMDEKFNVSLKYNADVFEYNLDEQYVEGADSNAGATIAIVLLIIFVIFIVIVIIVAISDSYDGGFGGGGSSVFIHHSSCACASSCACVSSCACACACAGGGRAGCTKKDFYGTNLRTENLKKALKE